MIAQVDVAMQPHAEDLGEERKKEPGLTIRRPSGVDHEKGDNHQA
jgi:hypothetical protein